MTWRALSVRPFEQALIDAVKLAVTRCAAAAVVAITSSLPEPEEKNVVSALVQTTAWEWMDAKETQTEVGRCRLTPD